MPIDRSVIKSSTAQALTFDYKPKDLKVDISRPARSFVEVDSGISPDFKISELVAKQTGISQLEDEAQKDKINAQVLDRLKEIEEKAYQEGHEVGLVEGTEKAFQEAKANLLERLSSIEAILKRMEELKTHLLADNEAELIRLVFLVAEKIALKSLEEDREAVQKILHSVVGETQADERVVVRISAEDLLFLEGLQDKTGQKMEALERVKFVPDEKITAGGCLIETEFGTVNATVEERLARTWQTLLGRIPQKPRENKEE